MSTILEVADMLESGIRKFLDENKSGGVFILPDCNGRELTIPLMILTFEEEGWDVEYDYDVDNEWLEFSKQRHDFFTDYEDDFISSD